MQKCTICMKGFQNESQLFSRYLNELDKEIEICDICEKEIDNFMTSSLKEDVEGASKYINNFINNCEDAEVRNYFKSLLENSNELGDDGVRAFNNLQTIDSQNAIKINFEGIIDSKGFIFDGYADYADKVFDTFSQVVKQAQVPLVVSLENFKSGGILSCSIGDMILISHPELSPTYYICIKISPFGKYLGVDMYMLADAGKFKKIAATALNFFNAATNSSKRISTESRHLVGAKNIFEAQDISIYWSCVEACLQETFSKLKFSEVKKGFLGVK